MIKARPMAMAVVLWLGLATGAAWAQDEELTLGVHRTFGYGAGSQIQGNFRLEASGPADLASVTFTLDGAELATDTEPPFETRFVTDDYATGWHELSATGTTAEGRTVTARTRRFEFVSSSQAFSMVGRIMLPLLAVVGVLLLVSVAGPMLASLRGRNQPPLPAGAPRSYGMLGGTICPKCHRPFSRHWWGLNMLTGKLDRCDHCGKWSIVRALPREMLDRAVAAELANERARQPAAPPTSAADELTKALEESRWRE